MPAGKATIDWDGYELLVKFDPFRPDIADEIKASIPQHSRRWDAEDRCWRVSTLFKKQIEDIFDVWEYAVRDYTGDDIASKMHQADLRDQRDARLKDAERARQQQADAKNQRAREEQARKEKADTAREQASGSAREQGGGRRSTGRTTYDANTGTYGRDDDTERAWRDAQKLIWRSKFFAAWPECSEHDFSMWWSLYLIHGRDEANRRFNDLKGFNRQQRRENSQNYARNRPKSVDHYGNLGIVRSCSKEEANRAYVALAQKYHPSSSYSHRTPDEEKMKQINASYDAIKTERGW